jgi:hypothetical protein
MINVLLHFEDEQHKKLKKIKNGNTWEDFILKLAEIEIEEDKQ